MTPTGQKLGDVVPRSAEPTAEDVAVEVLKRVFGNEDHARAILGDASSRPFDLELADKLPEGLTRMSSDGNGRFVDPRGKVHAFEDAMAPAHRAILLGGLNVCRKQCFLCTDTLQGALRIRSRPVRYLVAKPNGNGHDDSRPEIAAEVHRRNLDDAADH